MKEHTMPKQDKPQLKPPSQASPIKDTAEPLALEDRLLEEHRDDLGDIQISEEAAKAFLMSLFRIISAFVDLGFKIGPADAEDIINKQEKLSDLRVDVLRLLQPEDMPHETVAPRSSDNEKEQP